MRWCSVVERPSRPMRFAGATGRQRRASGTADRCAASCFAHWTRRRLGAREGPRPRKRRAAATASSFHRGVRDVQAWLGLRNESALDRAPAGSKKGNAQGLRAILTNSTSTRMCVEVRKRVIMTRKRERHVHSQTANDVVSAQGQRLRRSRQEAHPRDKRRARSMACDPCTILERGNMSPVREENRQGGAL